MTLQKDNDKITAQTDFSWRKTGEFVGLVIFGACFFILSIEYPDFMPSAIIFMVSFALLIFSIGNKYKVLLRIFSLFIFLHLLLFPWMYVVLINIDPNAFSIDNDIVSNETASYQDEIEEKYNPKNLIIKEKILSAILSSENSILDSMFSEINNNNVVFLDSLIFHKTSFNIASAGPPMSDNVALAICDSNGVNLTNVIDYGRSTRFSEDITIKDFFNRHLKKTIEENANYNLENNKLGQTEIWSFRRLLPYSINMIYVDNFNPKSRVANVFYFFHKLIIAGFLLSVAGTFITDWISKKRSEIKS